MRNEVILDFTINDYEDITHEDITKLLGIEPIKVFVKGQKRNSNFSAKARRNRWIINAGLDKFASFEDQMNALLDVIEGKIDLFRPLCQKYYCEFACGVFITYDNGDSTPSIHLDARYNRLTKELNIEFDVDLYCNAQKDG